MTASPSTLHTETSAHTTGVWKVVVAGTTAHTVLCAQALQDDARFAVQCVVTPNPRPIGRQQTITPNPLELWARSQDIKVVSVAKKLDATVQQELMTSCTDGMDILLVVDFGYLVPDWLLSLPRLAPLNVHPSKLPRWRGSSPGQFVLLYGETDSAVTVMRMSAGLDEGPIIKQIEFAVDRSWNQTEYYQHAFELLRPELAGVVAQYAQSCQAGEPAHQQQPETSPTPVARRLAKEDGFVEWRTLAPLVLRDQQVVNEPACSDLLQEIALATHSSWPEVFARAARALSPWPGLWTIIPTAKGLKRMKLLSCLARGSQLILETVQIEGQQPARWDQVKNVLNEYAQSHN